MGHGFGFRVFSYFLCVSFLLQAGGVSGILAQERGKNFPIGEMVSRGEVQYEAREGVWQKVDLSYFPIFQGSKIKTQKGSALLSLKNDILVEMGANTALYIERRDQIRLLQGHIHFRINSPEGLSIAVGKIRVANAPSPAASASPVAAKKASADMGTIRIQADDSVAIQSAQGRFLVSNPQGVTLAALSPKDSLTIPRNLLENPPSERSQKMMLAQVGDITPAPEEDTYLGLSKWVWGGIGLGVLALAGIGLAAGGGGGGGGSSSPPPVCPP
ncbi:MAG: hypothetical protein HXY45_07800 [Syntrophaceae bacterium]|nr:hypothetical protein [Syntrophaceae bacterium]